MNIFKKTLTALLMLSAMVSASAFANSAGDAKVKAAGELTIAKTQEAVALVEKGGDKAQALQLLGEVRQSQKEFRYEQTERLRQKAGDALRIGREELENGDANALTSLKKALGFYNEMMVIYKAAH